MQEVGFQMSLRISGKHMEIGDAFRTRIEGRIGEAIDKYFDGGFSGHVNVIKSGSRFTADCMIHLDSGMALQATGDAQEPTAAFDVAAERFEKRLRRYKRRLKSHAAAANGSRCRNRLCDHGPGGRRGRRGAGRLRAGDRCRIDGGVKTLTVASAVIELDTKDSPVFVFRNAGNGQVNVVYRRADGNIGWIDPAAASLKPDHNLLTGTPSGGAGAAGRNGAKDKNKMDLTDLIEVSAILPTLKANSKKQLLQLLADKAASATGIPEREIFDTIQQRERLGSTGVGNGIAIPHGKLGGVKRITGVFARLETPVDFEALDDQPVDLVFLLLAPEGAGADHLKALSRIARVLRDADAVAKIRGTRDAAAIHAFLASTPTSHAA